VNAAGMMQWLTYQWQGAACGSVYDAGSNWCGATVGFEPFSNVLSSISGSSIVT